jgi:DNA-binding MarR family transcriptional regulator
VTDASPEYRTADLPTVVALTGRDLEDACRLLNLLTQKGRISNPGQDVPSPEPEKLLAHARRILADRQKRMERFGRAMFGEPAWEMLLLLYVSNASARYTASRLAKVAGYSKATAIRWLDYLEREKLIRRRSHPTDQRSVFIELTGDGLRSLELYLTDTLA